MANSEKIENKMNDIKAIIQAMEWTMGVAKSLYEQSDWYTKRIKEEDENQTEYLIQQANEYRQQAEAMERLAEKIAMLK